MFNKTFLVVPRLTYSVNSSLSRHLSSCKGSYLRNPGSEPLTNATLGDVILQTANTYPGRVAIRSVQEDLTLTYEELMEKADRLGCALRAQGLEKGDRLGIWSHNNAAYVIAMVAAARVGLISVLINPVYEMSELSFCIKKSGMKSILIGDQIPNRNFYNKLRNFIPELQNATSGLLKCNAFPTLSSIITSEKEKLPGTLSFHSLIEDYSNSQVSKFSTEVKPEDGSIIHLTSGTTGDPKAALDSHVGIVNNTYFVGKRNSFHEGHQKVCLQAPLFHALGSIITCLGSLRHGASIVLAGPTYNVKSNLHALISEQCTAITGTPTMYVDMVAAVRSVGDVPSKLQMALSGGAPCSPQLIRDVQKHLKAQTVLALYGLSESTAAIFQSLPNDSIDLVADTVGYIHDHTEVQVVDEDGKQVPFGSSGELLSRGYSNMICYWDEPQKTRATIDDDGWLHTGDKFTISEDGYGTIVGRIKDIIVRGGENIAPKEIEDLLNTHPDIIESQVIGVSDERLGEELCAVLRVRDGATVTAQDISKYCSGKLAKFKIPRLLKVANEFPKTASGKIQKYKLRNMVEAGKL